MSKLRTRLFVMALVATIPAIAAMLYMQSSERERARARTLEDTLRLTRFAARQQASVFDGAHRLLLTLVQFPALRGDHPEQCHALLSRVLREHMSFSRLMLVDADGAVRCSSADSIPEGLTARDRGWFQKVLATRSAAVGDYQISRFTGEPDIVIAHPLFDNQGAVTRVLAVSVEATTLARLIESLNLPPGMVMSVFDRGRTILARHPDSSVWMGKQLPDSPFVRRAIDGQLRQLEEGVGPDGVSRLVLSLPIDAAIPTGLFVGVGVTRSVAFAEADRMLWRALWLIALVTLVTAIAAVAGSQFFVLRPVQTLIDVTKRVAGGDLASRAPIVHGIRELDELGHAFNSMTATLQAQQIERDHAEQLLRASEERYRMPFEHAPHPSWVYDTGTLKFIEVNRAACQHYGYTREEFLRMRITDIRPDEEVPRVLEGVERMVRQQETTTPSSWTHCKKDGTRITVEISSMLVTIAGRPACVVLAHDISERASLEQQLRQSQKMEAVGQLAGGVAHDFNNMLTAITGYSELVLDAIGDDHEMAPAVREIEKAGVRAAKLTRQLLAFSRKQLLTPVVLDPNAIVGEMDTLLRRLIGEHIELKITREMNLGSVKADPTQLEQVLLNLAVNARDAMTDGGTLTIQTRTEEIDEAHVRANPEVPAGRYAVISVRDTGTGMDQATVARIFEPFFTTKSSTDGTGLGLSVVYGIVRQSGGHVIVRSQQGRGSSFDVYLPRVDDPPSSEGGRRGRPRVLRGRETVLIAEDEDVVRRLLKTILSSGGYQVLEASDGVEALAMYQQHGGRVDLLVTDIVMPRMNGLELAQQLSALNPCLKVLCLSGYTAEATASTGPVIWPFLAKPFVPAALLERVREVLDAESAAA